jgi:hypothetical protein
LQGSEGALSRLDFGLFPEFGCVWLAEKGHYAVTDELLQLAEKADRLVRSARLQDLALLLGSNDVDRIRRISLVLEELGSGTFLIGTGPYAAGVYSVMADEIVLGRLATPLEDPLDMPVDIFCRDVPSLTPREVSRYHEP